MMMRDSKDFLFTLFLIISEKEFTSLSSSSVEAEECPRRKALKIDIKDSEKARSTITQDFSRKLIEEL